MLRVWRLEGDFHKSGEVVKDNELATRTGLAERYLREWLAQQAASEGCDMDVLPRGILKNVPDRVKTLVLMGAALMKQSIC
jgi:hypothetical protein